MTASSIQADQDSSAPATGVGWQWARAALGVISLGIGIYQVAGGNGMGGAFSFFMAATFLLSVASERAIVRTRQNGVAVPVSVLILACSVGASLGGSLVLGTLVAIRAL